MINLLFYGNAPFHMYLFATYELWQVVFAVIDFFHTSSWIIIKMYVRNISFMTSYFAEINFFYTSLWIIKKPLFFQEEFRHVRSMWFFMNFSINNTRFTFRFSDCANCFNYFCWLFNFSRRKLVYRFPSF